MTRTVICALCAAFVLAACKKEEAPPPPPPPAAAPAPAPAPAPAAVAVSNIALGSAIDAGKKVTAPAEAFAKSDTIYAAIDTTGSGNATLKVKWTYHRDGKVATVKEDSATIAPTGPATTEFHISKPDGWPLGDYQLDVTLDDKPAGTKKFSVK
ncbi:MAG: hypothetical protein KIT13_11205 [Burkholderiales bacterium]|nr:hypothetical protein [Burkholderiales bacterium]